MADFHSLPFSVHILICRNLNLHDCLNYSRVSVVCHDAVYYVFSHRAQLDLRSVISFSPYNYPIMTISSESFLNVLHAHTRATQIRNFLVPNDFTAFPEISNYFNIYWANTFLPSYDDATGDCSMVCGTYVGHIRGQLAEIHYLGFYGANTPQQQKSMCQLLNTYDDYYGVSINQEGFTYASLSDRDNWSTVDLDAPYTRCTNCHLSFEFGEISPSYLCQQCSHIQDVLSSIPEENALSSNYEQHSTEM